MSYEQRLKTIKLHSHILLQLQQHLQFKSVDSILFHNIDKHLMHSDIYIRLRLGISIYK